MGLIFWYQKSIFWYQKIQIIFYIKNSFFDIKNSNFWNQKINFRFKKFRVSFWYQKMIFWYQIFYFLISENDFLISRIWIFDIKKSTLFSDIKNSFTWYQEILFRYQKFELLISENDLLISRIVFWYKKNWIFYIKKSFSDIRKYLKNIKAAPHKKVNSLIHDAKSIGYIWRRYKKHKLLWSFLSKQETFNCLIFSYLLPYFVHSDDLWTLRSKYSWTPDRQHTIPGNIGCCLVSRNTPLQKCVHNRIFYISLCWREEFWALYDWKLVTFENN